MPRKMTAAESVIGLQDMKFRLQDIHGVDVFNGAKRVRRDDTETISKRPRKDKITNGNQLISSTSLELPTSNSYLPMLDSSSYDTATPPSSPCSDTFDKNKIDLRLLIEPGHPNLSSPEILDLAGINQKLLEPRDFAGDAVRTERMCR